MDGPSASRSSTSSSTPSQQPSNANATSTQQTGQTARPPNQAGAASAGNAFAGILAASFGPNAKMMMLRGRVSAGAAAASNAARKGAGLAASGAAPAKGKPLHEEDDALDPDARSAHRLAHRAKDDEKKQDARDLALLDPAARQAALLAPPLSSTSALMPPPATTAEPPLRARTLEELLPALVKRIAWAGDKNRGTVHLELGAGAYAGTQITVHADAGRVRVELSGQEGADLDRLRTRLGERLRGHGLDVESVT